VDDLKWAIAREIPHLRRYARTLLRDSDGADDLVQDCLERALRKRHLWRRTGSLRSWLFRIVFTQYLNGGARRSRAQRTESLDVVDHSAAMPAAQEHHAEAVEVLDALFLLDRDQRAAILLVAVEGMAYDEAADALGIPIGTLRSRLWRGREALRAMTTDRPGRGRTGAAGTTRLRRIK
jgi:RNA polymerase sigma-70 factor (ECF subfamily)